MIPKIENRKYTYVGNDICNVSATLNVYKVEGGDIISSGSLSANCNITNIAFVSEISNQLQGQAIDFLTKLNEIETLRKTIFPTSVDFDDAIDLIINPIQTAIGG